MTSQISKSLLGVSFAILLSFAVLGISILLTPQGDFPLPLSEPSLPTIVTRAAFWIGIASGCATGIVGTVLIIGKRVRKRTV